MPGTIRCVNCSAVYIIKDILSGKHDVEETSPTVFVADTEEETREKCPRCGDELPDELDCPHCARVQWVVIGCIAALALGMTLLGFWGCDSDVWSCIWITAGVVLFLVAVGDIVRILLPSVKKLIQGVHIGRLVIVGLSACIAVSAGIVIVNAVLTGPLAEMTGGNAEIAGKPQQDADAKPAGKVDNTKIPAQAADNTPPLNKPVTENAGKIASPPAVTLGRPDNFKLIDAAGKGDYNAAMNALQNGTSPDAVNNSGTPAIILAAQKGHSRLVKLLLDYKVNVNARDSLKFTALMWASARGRMETARLLLKNGANPHLKNAVGETALTISQDAEMDGLINQFIKDAMNTPDATVKKTVQ